MYGARRGVCRVFVARPDGRRPLVRSRRRWENNVKIDLRDLGWRAWPGSIWLWVETGGELL
jgi:hypothetical protein